jgi:hypothetical protein
MDASGQLYPLDDLPLGKSFPVDSIFINKKLAEEQEIKTISPLFPMFLDSWTLFSVVNNEKLCMKEYIMTYSQYCESSSPLNSDDPNFLFLL